MKTFEDYLQEFHMKDYHGTADDAPDAYEAFVSQLDGAEIMELAENYGIEIYKKGYIQGGIDTLNDVNRLASNPN